MIVHIVSEIARFVKKLLKFPQKRQKMQFCVWMMTKIARERRIYAGFECFAQRISSVFA